jgi:hypothetical protein
MAVTDPSSLAYWSPEAIRARVSEPMSDKPERSQSHPLSPTEPASMPVRSTSAREEWITDSELRHRLRYSKSTIQRLRARGLPCLGRGRLRRFHWPTVCDWLAEHRA